MTMPVLAPFAQISLVRSLASDRVEGYSHIDTAPFFESVCDSLSVWVIQNWTGKIFADLATLIIDTSVVSCAGVHPDDDGNLLAWPTLSETVRVVAYETTHNVAVILLHSSLGLINLVEVQEEIIFLQ
jgi:hypothetical protein